MSTPAKSRELQDGIVTYEQTEYTHNGYMDSSGIIISPIIYQYGPLQRRIRYPDYSDQSVRVESFKYWGGVLPAQELAEAGFYMIARCDVVRCFSCNVLVWDWERTDNAFNKHQRHSPNCPFLASVQFHTPEVLVQSGEQFIVSIDLKGNYQHFITHSLIVVYKLLCCLE